MAKRKKKTTARRIQDQMETILKDIVNGQPCAICKSMGVVNTSTAKHHLISKGSNGFFKYDLRNLIPLCCSHHMFSNDIAPHSPNSMAVGRFNDWVRDNLPKHWEFMKKFEKRNKGYKRSLQEWQEALECLQFWQEHYCHGEDVLNEDDTEENIWEII